MKAIKKNLVDQIYHPEDNTVMLCPNCGATFSANRGDYWDYKEDHVFQCHMCKVDMVLGHFEERWIDKEEEK